MSKALDCSSLEKEILTKVIENKKDKKITIAIITFNKSIYENLIIEKCLSLGIYFRHYKLDNSNTLEVISLINKLNKNNKITGILLVEPIPINIDKYACYEKIDINKDVDGVNPVNQYYLSINRSKMINSTVLAIIKILDSYNISLDGKKVTIIGRSYNISKPLATYLLNLNSTVTICHSKTKDLFLFLKKSDIIISATGVNNLFKSSDLKDNTVVIDIGLGDILIDSGNISYTSRIKGIGPLSVACLLENLVTYCKKIK